MREFLANAAMLYLVAKSLELAITGAVVARVMRRRRARRVAIERRLGIVRLA